MTDIPSVEELDALPTEELRRRAFERAEHHRDVGFFWDLFKHLRASGDPCSREDSHEDRSCPLGSRRCVPRPWRPR